MTARDSVMLKPAQKRKILNVALSRPLLLEESRSLNRKGQLLTTTRITISYPKKAVQIETRIHLALYGRMEMASNRSTDQ